MVECALISVNEFCRNRWYCFFIFSFIILITGASWLVNTGTYHNHMPVSVLHNELLSTGMASATGSNEALPPWTVGLLPGGDALITAPNDHLRLVRNFTNAPRIVAEPVAVIPTGMPEGYGLLSIAIHPDFIRTRLFYLCLNVQENGNIVNRIELWRLSEDGAKARRITIITSETVSCPLETEPDFGRGDFYVGTGGTANNRAFISITNDV
jgi:hypothetical protein